MSYGSAATIRREVAELFKPPRRVSVADAAQQYLKIALPGGYYGSWDSSLTPYMVEPMNCLASREYDAVVFMAPARTGKTQALVDAWVAYMVVCDPSDMMVVQTTQDLARDYSRRRVDRMIRHSAEIKNRMSPFPSADNVFDKTFKAGNILTLSWPTISQLSGRDIRLIALTDFDRMPENLGGGGNTFLEAQKRTQTYLSGGMILVESSPGHTLSDPDWEPLHPHEAPPVQGIAEIYNQGDRRRLYWPCLSCGDYFIEDVDLLDVDTRQLPCPVCGSIHKVDQKRELYLRGRWLRQGQSIAADSTISGNPRTRRIASFWMTGAAAAFQTWDSLIQKMEDAREEFERSGNEEPLKTVTHLDAGKPYLYKSAENRGYYKVIQERAEPNERFFVPEGVRTLIATVDVQGGKNARFVVQVLGFGMMGEQWLVDRYSLTSSNRDARNGKKARIDPAGYIEDWDILTEKIVNSTYRLESMPGMELKIYRIGCDSGGSAGVTERAYAWYRSLRSNGLHRKVLLLKGAAYKNMSARIKKTYPDSTGKKGKNVGAGVGDVPIWILNTNAMKDAVYSDLQREDPGPRYIHFPHWLNEGFFKELTAEVRTDSGWRNIGEKPNEAFDLLGYARAVWIEIGGDKIAWNPPPPWAQEWDTNSEVITKATRKEIKARPIRKAQRRARFKFN